MVYYSPNRLPEFFRILTSGPASAAALIKGSPSFPDITGTVAFYEASPGTLVYTELSGLPFSTLPCSENIFAFHIHEGTGCTGTETDPFADAKMHLNPGNCPHPSHMGDLPPVFSNEGYAFSIVFTDRFSIDDILGHTIILHSRPDDFTTQPAGNSGEKIACGVIQDVRSFPRGRMF